MLIDARTQLSEPSRNHLLELVVLQLLEPEHAASRQQRSDDLEGWVFSRRADQGDRAVFDVRQDGVLLRLVEAVDLVDEQDRAQSSPPVHLGLGHDLAQVGDAGRHRRHRHHPRASFRGQKAGQGGLSAPWRTPKNDAWKVPRAGQLPQNLDHRALANQVLKPLRAQPGRERRVGLRPRRHLEKLPLAGHRGILTPIGSTGAYTRTLA